MLNHDEIKFALANVVKLAFKHSKCKFISIYNKSSSFVNKPKASTFKFDQLSLLNSLNYLIDNCYFIIGENIFKQIIGVPIGVDPGPYIANLTLWYYENKYIEKLYRIDYFSAKRLNNTFRLIDDITSINGGDIFKSHVDKIYPCSLLLNKENECDSSANVLDLNVKVNLGKFDVEVYDKRENFPFDIVQYISRSSNVSRNTMLCVFCSQIVRFFRICNKFEGFKKRVKIIVKYFTSIKFDDKLLDSKYRYMSSKHKFEQKFVEAGTLNSIFDND